jgi:hypothetical protein
MPDTHTLVIRIPGADYARLSVLAAKTGATRSKLIRVGLASVWSRDTEALRAEVAVLYDGRSTRRQDKVRETPNEDDRPAGNGTAVEVAVKERRNAQATARAG